MHNSTRLVFLALLALLWCGCSGSTAPVDGADGMEAPEDSEPEMPEDPVPPPPPPPPEDDEKKEATFRITFRGTWTAARHPTEFPSGAHFSAPVGTVHAEQSVFWNSDGVAIASDGIEQMAETGSTGTARDEIDDLITDGRALSGFTASGVGATGSTSIEVTATELHHFLSLTSMIAPSPDWFLGVRNVDLCPGGAWIDRLEIDLTTVYDAGTDAGQDFDSNNSDVTPHDPIHRVGDNGAHFVSEPLALATLVIERIIE